MATELRQPEPRQRSVQLHAQWFHQLNRNASGAIFLFDARGRIDYVSSPVLSLLGYENRSLLGTSIYDTVHEDDLTQLREIVERAVATPGKSAHVACRLARLDGTWVYVEGVAVGSDQEAEPICLMSTWDVTARRRNEALLRKRAQWFQALTRNSRDVITVFGSDDECLFVSGSAEIILGQDPDAMSWFVFTAAIHASDRERVLGAFSTCREDSSGSVTVEYRRRRTDGSFIHVESHAVNKAFDPEVKGLIIYTHDISERKGRDPLTSLPNRTAFSEEVETLIETPRSTRERFAVLLLQLDRLSEVETGLGYHLADQLLLQLTGRLRERVRPGDVVARLERDQFAVLLKDLAVGEEVQQVARRIRRALDEPFVLGDHELVTTATVGIATGAAVNYVCPDDVLRAATTALQVARQTGANGQACYETGMFHSIEDRFHLEHELRHALADETLELHYQPIIDLRTRRIVAFEALLRWFHPKRGLVSPERIVETALQTGLMAPLGEWVLQRACRELASWKRRTSAARDLVVNVNLAAEQLNQPDLCAQVERILRGARLHPRHLKLEVTETSIIANPEAAAETMECLREKGVRLALDDFGTGYSSLAYLHQFQFDAIKIDRSFVMGIGTEKDWSRHVALIRTIVAMGASLGTTVVAEGIETSQQLELLSEIGCGQGQGYYFSRPVPGRSSVALLDRTG